jgi:hypothetical protein
MIFGENTLKVTAPADFADLLTASFAKNITLSIYTEVPDKDITTPPLSKPVLL